MSERRERKITMGDDDVCVVCFKDITIRCIMDCEHSICFECSTRLRVLCDKLECPICRQETTIAVFTREKGSFRSVYMRALYNEDKYKLALEDEGVRRAFSLLQAHACTKCQPPRPFPVFKQLADHMLRQHQLQYCELCVKHLRIFTSERKLYTREKLALHKRKGDPDDSSHRGHPLCEYCQQRYNDKDELFLHLRRDHFHCHLCDADGKQIFYDDYAHLADHFREDHFFCEQGACKDEKFVVFRSDIDLQAHRASVHSEGKSRSQQRQDRTLTLEFSTEPAGRRRRNDGRYERNDGRYERNDRGYERNDRYDRNADRREPAGPPEPPPSPPPLMAPSIPVNTSSQQEFPTLSVGGATGGADLPASRGSLAQRVATAAGKTVRTTAHKGAGRPWDNRPVSVNDEEFPTLGGGRAAPPPPPPAAAAASTPAFSVNVNKRGGKHGKNAASRQPTAAGNTAAAAAASAKSTEDFPSLAPPPPRPVSAPVITRPAPPRATHAAAAAAGASLNLTAQKKQKKPESAAKAAVKAGTAAGRAASVAIDFKKRPASASVAAAIAAAAAAEYDFEHELEEEEVPRISQVSNTSNIRIARPEPAPAARPAGKGSRPPPIASDDAFPTLGKSSKTGGGASWVTKKAEPAPKPKPPAAAPPLPTGSDFPTLNPVSAHGNFGSFAGPRGGQTSGGSAWGGGKKGKKGKKGGGGGGGENGNASASAAAAVAAAEAAAGALNGLSLSARASDGTFQYQEPDNFTARNGRLVQLARDLCDTEEQFEAFKSLSKAFRDSETSAEFYYSSCLTLLGNDRFGKIFQELLVLLPNIARQQELLAAHEKLNRNGFTRNKFPSCPTCGQVLVFDDLAMHTSQHFEDGDFPVLG